jgi:hypothetical protein
MVHIKHLIAFVSVAGLAGTLGGCSVAGAGSGAEDLGQTAEAISTDVCPPNVPAALAPPAGETLKSKLMGVGVQIYMCTGNVNVTPTTFAWTFVGPNANLLNEDGKLVGTHFIGPTWQGNDGSSVVGAKKVGVSVDPSAVPWLRLAAVSHGTDSGRFDDVTSIQRLSTVGGNAPADGCDAAHVGSIAQVPYTADYVFYRAKESGPVKQCGGT